MILSLLLSLAQVPDVVVVVGDDIARSDLDYVDTPSLDYLASRGVAFRRAYAHPLCSPTRRSLMFGRWPGRHTQITCGAPGARSPEPSEYSLPKVMKAAGYATGIFGKWHLGSNSIAPWEVTPQLHGFDVWQAGLPSNVTLCGGASYTSWRRAEDGFSSLSSEYQTHAVRDAFRDWWLSTPGPRFAYVAFQAPHAPLHVPPDVQVPFQQSYTNRQMYEYMIESLDLAIGEMLGVVDLDETVFFFVGDNGTPGRAVRTNQRRNKVKRTTFEDGINVPLLVAGPGVAEGHQSNELVHTVDFLATIAELAGQRVPGHLALDSRSFRHLLAEPAAATTRRPYVYCENDTPGLRHDRAVVTRRYKLRNVEGVEELYDLVNDPTEEQPLDLEDPAFHELLEGMRATLANPSLPADAVGFRTRSGR